MKSIEIIPLKKPISKDITLPGCLSYTIRALALAAMTKGRVIIKNALKSDDTAAMFGALMTLGIDCDEGDDFFVIKGNVDDVKDNLYEININISGRSARTLLALLCIVRGTKILTCKEGFKRRPVGDMVEGLRLMGAKIEYLEKEGFLPVKIYSSKLNPGKIKMKGNLSSQFVSGILMVAPLVGEIAIEVIGEQASKPFIDMTIEAMRAFGVKVNNKNYKEYIVMGGQVYKNSEYFVEPDAISASYFWSIAAITGSRIRLVGLSPESKQGDMKYVDFLEMMGCRVRRNAEEGWIEVEGNKKLRGIQVDMNDTPDSAQTLAVTAAFAEGITIIKGIGHLKIKETDRIEAPKNELIKMGVEVSSTADSLKIIGGDPHGATIETYGDHRMAMAFAVAGTRIPGIIINNPDVVSKSFPGFWGKIQELGIGIRFQVSGISEL